MTYLYNLYCQTISLPFPCEFLPPAEARTVPDVTVAYGAVPRDLTGAVASGENRQLGYAWQAARDRFLFKGGVGSARFLVEGCSRVTVERNFPVQDERLLDHFLHPVSAVLFRQQGFLTLHACAACYAGDAVVLCGPSRAGKSTTLAAVLRKGGRMLSDDLSVLRLGPEGVAEVLPGPPKVDLRENAEHSFDIDIPGAVRGQAPRGKGALLAPGELGGQPAPLRKLHIIEPYPGEDVSVSRLSGLDGFDALLGCVYGLTFPDQHPGLFTLLSTVLRQADVILIQRPEHRWSLHEVLKVVLDG